MSNLGVNKNNFNDRFEHLGVLLQTILSNFWDANINGLRGYKLSKWGIHINNFKIISLKFWESYSRRFCQTFGMPILMGSEDIT